MTTFVKGAAGLLAALSLPLLAGAQVPAPLPPAKAPAALLPARLGIWQGQVGTRRVVLTLGRDSSTLTIPENQQPANRLVTLRAFGDSLVGVAQFTKPILRAKFDAKGRVLTGTYIDYSKSMAVVLRPVAAVQPLRLAQAPALPLPYRAEEVQFASDSIRIGGTLTHPTGARRVPAVVLLSGTGPQNRNGAYSASGHQPFEVLADYLTRRGFAVLRTDDRGVGKTTGNYSRATTADFAQDALAAVRYLRSRPDIDPAQIGLIGHSEGGGAALIAAAQSSDVAFVVSLAGLLTPGLTALEFQNSELVRTAAIPARNKARFNTANALMFSTAYQYANSPELETRLRAAYADWHAKDEAQLKADKADNDHFFYPFEGYVHNATGPWYRYNVRFDPTPYFAKIKVPFLGLNGDRDVMIDYHGLATAATALRQAGNPDVTVQVLPGLNHLLQPCHTCLSTEYSDLNTTLDPVVLRTVGDWLAKHTQ